MTKTLWVHSANEHDTSISADEFHIFNWCLDDAIAEAVTSFGRAPQVSIDGQAGTLQERVAVFTDEHQGFVGMALQAYAAINTGNVGLRDRPAHRCFIP